MMPLSRVVTVSVMLVTATLSAAVTGCSKGAAGDTPAPPARHLPPGEVQLEPPEMTSISVDTVRARTQHVVATLPAQLVLDEDHTVRVLSPVAGRIRTLDVKPGDIVVRGQALAHVVSSDLAQALSDKAKADAATGQSSAALVRAESLYAYNVIAVKDLEQARAQAESDRAEAERAAQRVQQLGGAGAGGALSPIHISEPTRLLSTSYAVICLESTSTIARSPFL